MLVAPDGRDLPIRHVTHPIGRVRNWIVVKPGAAVEASLSITGWDGTEQADYFLIQWPGGRKRATVHGSTHAAERRQGGAFTSSSPFRPVNITLGRPATRLDLDRDEAGLPP